MDRFIERFRRAAEARYRRLDDVLTDTEDQPLPNLKPRNKETGS